MYMTVAYTVFASKGENEVKVRVPVVVICVGLAWTGSTQEAKSSTALFQEMTSSSTVTSVFLILQLPTTVWKGLS